MLAAAVAAETAAGGKLFVAIGEWELALVLEGVPLLTAAEAEAVDCAVTGTIGRLAN